MTISGDISYRYCNDNPSEKVAEVSLPTRHEMFKVGYRGGRCNEELSLRTVKLMAHNPKKIALLEKYGLKVSKRVPITLNSPSPRVASTFESKKIKSFILSSKGSEAVTG